MNKAKHDVYRGELMALLQRYYSRGCPQPDPRKHSKERMPRKTDAPTGYGYFFGDNHEKTRYKTFDPDISTTRGIYNTMCRLGVHITDESYDVFHARMVEEKRLRDNQ